MKLFGHKKLLDEREQLEMYHSEHKVYWFVFWILLAGTLIQRYVMNAPFGQYAFEGGLLLAVSIWSLFSDYRHGIYDTVSKPGWRSYLTYSLLFSVGFTLLMVYYLWRQGWVTELRNLGLSACILWLFLFWVMYAALAAWGVLVKRRRRQLEEQFTDKG